MLAIAFDAMIAGKALADGDLFSTVLGLTCAGGLSIWLAGNESRVEKRATEIASLRQDLAMREQVASSWQN